MTAARDYERAYRRRRAMRCALGALAFVAWLLAWQALPFMASLPR